MTTADKVGLVVHAIFQLVLLGCAVTSYLAGEKMVGLLWAVFGELGAIRFELRRKREGF